MQSSYYELLSWDSQFFGFPVGKFNTLDQGHESVKSNLATIVQSPHCQLLYIQVDPEDAPTKEYVTQLGAQLVDSRMVFNKNIDICHSVAIAKLEASLEVYTGSKHKELNALAFLAGRYSRFRTDPGISESDFQRLYRLWIERSVSGIIANRVLITRDQNNIPSSLITLSFDNGIGTIGLLAVREDQQGKGLGKILVDKSLDYFRENHCTSAEVVTQGDNSAACNLYEKSGFIPVLSSLTYHLWLPYSSTDFSRKSRNQ